MRKIGAILRAVGRAVRAAMRLMKKIALAPFSLFGSGKGGEVVEIDGGDIGEELETIFDSALDNDLTPQQRVEAGLEPQDVLAYLTAPTPEAIQKAGNRLTMKTRNWLDSLSQSERQIIIAADPQSLGRHLGGIEAIKNLRAIGDFSGVGYFAPDPHKGAAMKLTAEQRAMLHRNEKAMANVVPFTPTERIEPEFSAHRAKRVPSNSRDEWRKPTPPAAMFH